MTIHIGELALVRYHPAVCRPHSDIANFPINVLYCKMLRITIEFVNLKYSFFDLQRF